MNLPKPNKSEAMTKTVEERLEHLERGLGNLARGLQAAGRALEAIDHRLRAFQTNLAKTRDRIETTHADYNQILTEKQALASSLRKTVEAIQDQAGTVHEIPKVVESRLALFQERQSAIELSLSDLMQRVEALESSGKPH